MHKRTWLTLGPSSSKAPIDARWRFVLLSFLIAACWIAMPMTAAASGGVSQLGRFMPDRLGRGMSSAAKAPQAAETPAPVDAESVSYQPLAPPTEASDSSVSPEDAAAATPEADHGSAAEAAGAKDADQLLDPAEKAARRAEEFRLTLDAKDLKSETGVSAGDAPADAAEAPADAEPAETGAEAVTTVDDTMKERAAGGSKVVPDKALNFENCVHLALRQSPYFVDSAMEVQLQRINESDTWYQLLPKLLVSTGYVVSGPDIDNSDRFSLSFSTGNYDPFTAGFSISAAKLVTQIAILGHMSSINNGLYNLGNMFMTLGQLEQLLVVQDELVSLAMHEKTYLSNLLETGGANPLEVRIAEQQVEMAVLQRESLEARRDELKDDLKIFLGLGVEDNLELDLADSGDQVLGYFRPEDIGVETVRKNNIELKIQQQTREIQEYNIKLAWAKYLPKFYFQARTADPIDKDDADDGLYTSVGFTWTLWDWGERYRNVRRQRLNSRQDLVKENIMELDISSDWRSGLSTKRRTSASLKVARAEVELAGLRKRQGEISYQAGTQPFPAYLAQIREYFLARKEALDKELQDDKAMFELRFMSGDLFNSYINAKEI